jgi:hypothetical protein
MSAPISPAPVQGHAPDYLPAFISNGVIGLRVRAIPLMAGVASVSGLAGIDPVTQISSSPFAPYPLAGDITLGELKLSDILSEARIVKQAYDFACGELTSRFEFRADEVTARVEVLTFCSKTLPALVLQETTIRVDQHVEVMMMGSVDPRGIAGSWEHRWTSVPGQDTDLVDGALAWSTYGGVDIVGVSYSTDFSGADDVQVAKVRESQAPLGTQYCFKAEPGRPYRLRQIAAMVPRAVHHQPEAEAIRLVAEGCVRGFDELRADNHAAWTRLWRGRILLHGADDRWQALADAALFYLLSTVHPSSLSSVHIFGLARWTNYNYYYGHVMWDVETFVLPPLLVLQPDAGRAVLEFRKRTLEAARLNALARGYQGILYPWESDPQCGEEATVGTATGAAHEQHVNMDVALAFARYVHATGDDWYLRDHAWPILRGVAEWICDRVELTDRGYEIRRSMGIAEREEPTDNAVFVNMSASMALREAIDAARRIGLSPPDKWREIASGMVISMNGDVILSHDGYKPDEEKGATPDALAGIFPVGYPVDERVERATIEFYLDMADKYIGSPMLSALYGAWACRIGDRERALRLFEGGYADFVSDRFMNTHEYREDRFPDQPVAGPFFANIGGFLMSLLYGLPRIELGSGEPESWLQGPIVLPAGWEAIEVEQVWVRGCPMRLVARHGDERASLTPA